LCASCKHDTHHVTRHAAHATMLLSQNGTTLRALASRYRAAFAHTKLSMGEQASPNRPVHTCRPLRRRSPISWRGAHSSSYDEASLKAEEISEGRPTHPCCAHPCCAHPCAPILVAPILVAPILVAPILVAPSALHPHAPLPGIALASLAILAASREARRGGGTATAAADVADVACGPYRRKGPFRGSKLRLGLWVYLLREACLVVLLPEPGWGAARRGRHGRD
jgi:hypothetical protein